MSEFILRLKLLLRDRTAVITYIVSTAVVLAVLLSLNLHAAERSSIPIGVLDEDRTASSEELVQRLKECESLYVYFGESFEEQESLFLDGYINSIFIIPKGYSESLLSGDTDELITIYSARDDRIATILCDITAGCMIREICVNKAYNRYEQLDTDKTAASEEYSAEKLSREDYSDLTEQMLRDDPDYSFTFTTTFTDVSDRTGDESRITNGMMYVQMIAGMLCMLFMLVSFGAGNTVILEYENGLAGRRSVTTGSRFLSAAEGILASLCYELPLCILAGALLKPAAGVSAFLEVVLLNIVFVAGCSIFFYFLAHISGTIVTYQLLGSIFIVCMGVTGFISVFSGLMGREIFTYLPDSLYISRFVKIMGREIL